jgi:CRP-like cAMP-binding protein
VIIAEYEPGDTFFFIQSGSVQLAKCVNGAIKNLDILNAGEMFGEMSILEDSPRSATGIALTKVQVLEFDRQNFNQLITGSPAVALSLLKLFCRRIYDQKRRFRVLGISDFPARIADVFLMFDEMDKSLKTNDRMRNFNLTVQDVALWAALPLDIVRNEIDKYVERRKIEVSNNCIVVMNIQDFRRNVDQYLAQRAQDQARHVKR